MSTQAVEKKPIDRQQVLLFASYGMVLLAGLNTGWMGPLLPAIAKSHNLPLAALGTVFSIQFVGCVSTMLISKKTIDSVGVRKAIIMSSLLALSGCLLMSISASTSATFLYAGALLFGCSGGINSIAGTIVALRLAKGNSASALNKMHLFFGLGALSGPLIGWSVLQTPLSYSGAFLLGTCIALFLMSLAIFSFELPKRESPREVPSSHETLKEVVFWLFSLSMFFYVGIETGAAAWLFVYLTKASQLPHAQAALGMSALWLGLTTGRFWGGALCKTHNPQKVATIFMGLALSMLILLTVVPKISIFALIVVLLIGIGFGPVFPTILALVNLRYAHSEALVTSVAICTAFMGGIIFPWIAGYIFHGMGMPVGMSFLVGGATFMIVLFAIAATIANKNPVSSIVENN